MVPERRGQVGSTPGDGGRGRGGGAFVPWRGLEAPWGVWGWGPRRGHRGGPWGVGIGEAGADFISHPTQIGENPGPVGGKGRGGGGGPPVIKGQREVGGGYFFHGGPVTTELAGGGPASES